MKKINAKPNISVPVGTTTAGENVVVIQSRGTSINKVFLYSKQTRSVFKFVYNVPNVVDEKATNV